MFGVGDAGKQGGMLENGDVNWGRLKWGRGSHNAGNGGCWELGKLGYEKRCKLGRWKLAKLDRKDAENSSSKLVTLETEDPQGGNW